MTERPTVAVEANTADGVRITIDGIEIIATKYTSGETDIIVHSNGNKVEVRS
jgi:hypothetical protein